eukprot:gene6187-biopygen205
MGGAEGAASLRKDRFLVSVQAWGGAAPSRSATLCAKLCARSAASRNNVSRVASAWAASLSSASSIPRLASLMLLTDGGHGNHIVLLPIEADL